jgi:EAL domain-containing protein (putative c-di-GMP-specific phosphodiesterase class I)
MDNTSIDVVQGYFFSRPALLADVPLSFMAAVR